MKTPTTKTLAAMLVILLGFTLPRASYAEDVFAFSDEELDEALYMEEDGEPALENEEREEAEMMMTRRAIQRRLESNSGQMFLRFLERRFPEAKEHMLNTLEEDPFEARELMERLGELMREYRQLARHSPAEAEMLFKHQRMELLTHKLAEDIHRAREAERFDESVDASSIEMMENKLRGTLDELLEMKLRHQRLELADLEQEVKELRRLLKFREDNREKIIEKRMDDLLGEHDPLGW